MRVSDFSYALPEGSVAKYPPKVRGTSRLLVLNKKTGELQSEMYRNLYKFLRPGDAVVLNDTRVMRARIFVQKRSDHHSAKRELVVLEKHSGDKDWHCHKVLYRGKLKVGDRLTIGPATTELTVEQILGDGLAVVRSDADLLELTEQFGLPPLPPYMKRAATAQDIERYQTVFAREQGSAAAPTASLNMTSELIDRLKDKGVVVAYLTLHVGLGTFMPIRTDEVEGHKMHAEYFEIPKQTVQAITAAKAKKQRVVAVGTTVARTLEYASGDILKCGDASHDISGEADIFIYPGYNFKIVDTLLTNFHAPKSTVLMLTAAFAGWDNLKPAYGYAIKSGYKLLSYGDSMIVV
ncbi:MAG: tRNA preQ1(34) S-adenosylmethionine ribosyltransferase-isomerase QueA [Candidatus Nomurabacteria bacterium]|nr:tRNA preQ1(34) S-adenosylmethionine ribosyltransferase-isomerase QueA [Candidatus Nomurabacteria bacterium]